MIHACMHMARLKSLAEKLTNFQLTIDSDEGLRLLEKWPPQGRKWNVLLMIDVGYGRGHCLQLTYCIINTFYTSR
jgi:D-serine deaminase-like pyridoxal phosphate-dependent protein